MADRVIMIKFHAKNVRLCISVIYQRRHNKDYAK